MGIPQAKQSVHLSYESVFTEDGKPFSSRSKEGLSLEKLRSEIEKKIVDTHLKAYRGEWSEEEIQKTAKMIALGALKYGMLKVDASSTIRFVLEDWLRLDGDTGPYLQYVHARCNSLLEKVADKDKGIEKAFELQHETEKELLVYLSRFNTQAHLAGEEYRPTILASYLYELCKYFNRFYKECPIKTATGTLKQSRLALVRSVKMTLKNGLELLGIPAPQRM